MSAALSRKCAALRALAASGGYGPAAPLALLLDMDALRERVGALRTAFPEPHWHHCFAVKANPTRLVLAEAVALGMGLEAASIGELRQAKRAGCPMDKVVYDSPLKAPDEIAECLREGAALNIDNLQELDQVAEALSSGRVTLRPHQRIGVRVNPQVGAGSLSGYSTGTATSKFGVGLRDHDGAPVAAAYERYEWLNCIMCHVGSQGVSVDLAVAGIEAVVRFALDVNRTLGRRQIRHLDIGGGLAVNFSSDEHRPTFAHYADALRATVPELFQPTLWDSVATEFGRALCAKIGFFASRVEYVKGAEDGEREREIHCLNSWVFFSFLLPRNGWPPHRGAVPGRRLRHSHRVSPQRLATAHLGARWRVGGARSCGRGRDGRGGPALCPSRHYRAPTRAATHAARGHGARA